MWDGLAGPYGAIVADPPWHYDEVNPPNPATGYQGAGLPYSAMPLDEIKALPVGDLAEDTRLFLWTTNRYLRDSWDVIEAWGFTPQTRTLVWCKPPMGTLNVTTEFVVVGKMGKPAAMPWTPTTWYQWPRGQHSAKPPAFGDLVEQWCPGPYAELFARRQRLGWDSWGHGYEIGQAA